MLLVAIIATAAALLVTASHEFSAERIAANRRMQLLNSLHSVLGPGADAATLNPISVTAPASDLIGDITPAEAFVVVDGGRPVSAVISVIAPDGYNAPIQLLIGVSADAEISGVRVISHRETPGLGDAIDIRKSDWIEQFDGTRIGAPELGAWAADKDGGRFDSITGATVTTRAVVTAVKNALLYFQSHRQALFEAATAPAGAMEPGRDD